MEKHGKNPQGAQLQPRAEKRHFYHQEHGVQRHDAYAWLKAENWQEVMHQPDLLPSDIRRYLEAENSYCNEILADTQPLQKQLFEEMKARIPEADSSLPTLDGPYGYYRRFQEGQQYPLICRCPRKVAEESATPPDDGRYEGEEILLDVNQLAEARDYFQLGDASHSDDHRKLAYSFDDKGSEYYGIKILDLESGQTLKDSITHSGGGMVWSNDGKALYYTRLDNNHRPYAVYRHPLGATGEDEEVYREKDAGFFVGVGKSLSGRFIIINSHDHESTEIRLIDQQGAAAVAKLLAPREKGVEYGFCDIGEDIFIQTNDRAAEDYRIAKLSLSDAFCQENASPAEARQKWEDFVPHEKGSLLLGMSGLKNHLIYRLRRNGLPQIVVHRLSDGRVHKVAFQEEAYDLNYSAGAEFESEKIRLYYSSMTTPAQVFDHDLGNHKRCLRKEQSVPSGHRSEDYKTQYLLIPSHDGQRVPVTLLYHKDTKLGAKTPLLLYGYGSYGHSMTAGFNTNRLSLVNRGFVYAQAHVRGGMDKGYHWYKDAKGRKKQNTFKDFIAVAEGLIEQGYCAKGMIAAHGGSAGGMLMGAIANMRPDLFKAIVADVPFVDVLTTMCDASLPLTPPEWPEWGNPIESRKAYDSIAAYSPYDNVTEQAYPHLLATAGLTDPRVTYWEPAKWIAKLREKRRNNNMLLLHTNMSAGHGGASGRFERLKEAARNYAFILKAFNRV